ncbi:MAG: wax ester/triacylglycerol synthase family O-acyltransferase [Panacagrimonas sp.]
MMKTGDAGFLIAEGPSRGAQVSMLTTWSLPKGAKDDFLGKLVAHWRGCKNFAAPFNLRVKPGALLPDWETLSPEQIDLDYHLYHSGLPKPGGERELGVLASRLHSIPLDRSRPLWEMHVIEGLEGGRFALLFKLHHAQIDGMGAIRLIERVLSPDASTRNMPAFWEVAPKPAPEKTASVRKNKPSDLGKLAKAWWDMQFGKDPDSAAPFDAPMTVLNSRLKQPRRVATQLYETARLTGLAKKAGVTMNDVALSISAGALRKYLLERGELPDKTLTAGLPVSLRDDSGVGNSISFIVTKLHTGIADPLKRLRAINRSTSVAKERYQTLPSKMTRETLGTLVMAPYIGQVAMNLGGRYTPVFNVVISNVPGPREFLYLNGARMEAFYPISLIFDGQALNITFLSYAGRCAVGFTSGREAVPHMQRIAVSTGEALIELEKALEVREAVRA